MPGTFTPKPVPPLRRTELTVPAAPTATPVDTDVFEGASDGKRYVLPRYAIAFDKIGLVEEPRIAIADRQGTPTLVVTLNETPSPAAAADTSELQHVLSVTLKYPVPVVDGGDMVQEILFPSVLLDATETVITAELPLATPGERRGQILAALASLTASARLVVGRGITVGVPTGEHLPDGAPGYRVRKLLIDWIPAPRRSFSGSPTQPARRREWRGRTDDSAPRHVHGASHSYWQNPASPEHFYFLPDRFLLARAPDGGRAPLLRVRAAATAGDDAPRIAFEFQARPVIDADRIGAARPQLETAARQRGGTGPLALEIMPDPQPLLRLACRRMAPRAPR